MLIKEFRIVLPLTTDEYRIGQLYTTMEKSKAVTGAGEGVEVLKNEPFTNGDLKDGQYTEGQYTKKIYRIASKLPPMVVSIAPSSLLKKFDLEEEAWNAFPYCKTVITCSSGNCVIESIHLNDDGSTENALDLTDEELKQRQVEYIDIVNDEMPKDEIYDPRTFVSERTSVEQLTSNWKETASNLMCCYKLVRMEAKLYFGNSTIENAFVSEQKKLFTSFHRMLVCLIDDWIDMDLDDIRKLEDDARDELREKLAGESADSVCTSDRSSM